MTGVDASPGGVRGGTSGSGFWPRERRWLGMRAGLGSASGFGVGAGSGLVSAAWFFSPELFFDLNTSLNRLVDEDRFALSSGGPRLERLPSDGGAESRLSELSRENVDESVAFLESCSGLCAACTRGDEVVK